MGVIPTRTDVISIVCVITFPTAGTGLTCMRNMLKDRPVFVRDGDHADTFIISTKQESREKRRQKVLDKLTAEERELLGV